MFVRVMKYDILPGGTRRNIGANSNFVRARSANIKEGNARAQTCGKWDGSKIMSVEFCVGNV